MHTLKTQKYIQSFLGSHNSPPPPSTNRKRIVFIYPLILLNSLIPSFSISAFCSAKDFCKYISLVLESECPNISAITFLSLLDAFAISFPVRCLILCSCALSLLILICPVVHCKILHICVCDNLLLLLF